MMLSRYLSAAQDRQLKLERYPIKCHQNRFRSAVNLVWSRGKPTVATNVSLIMSLPNKSRVGGRKSYHKDHGSPPAYKSATADRGYVSSDGEEDAGGGARYRSAADVGREKRALSPSYRAVDSFDESPESERTRRRTNKNTGSAGNISRSLSPVAAKNTAASSSASRSTHAKSESKKKHVPLSEESTASLHMAVRNASNSGCLLLFGVIIVLLVTLGVFAKLSSGSREKMRKNCTSIDSLQTQFPHQDAYFWRVLKSGVEGVLNGEPPKPSIILFLHRNDNSTRNFVKHIVDAAATCFDPALKAVKLDSDEFNSEDALIDKGVVIERYREALQTGGVAFIADLNKISSQMAEELHFICDNENPLIRNVVIFLSLKPLSDVGKPVQIAEDTLNTIWGQIEENTLSALVARVTDQVLQVQPE